MTATFSGVPVDVASPVAFSDLLLHMSYIHMLGHLKRSAGRYVSRRLFGDDVLMMAAGRRCGIGASLAGVRLAGREDSSVDLRHNVKRWNVTPVMTSQRITRIGLDLDKSFI